MGPERPGEPPVSRETGGPGGGGEPERSVSRETPPAAGIMARLALWPIRMYRRFVSPVLAPRCRYYPTCSAYAEEAIGRLGAARGIIVAAWRVLRCNPLSPGGLDPLENRRLFRSHSAATGAEQGESTPDST